MNWLRGSLKLWQVTALMLTVQILNAVDAELTLWLIRHGLAAEANPVIGFITFPGKIMIGVVGSVMLARVMPRALLVPAVALTCVVAYEILRIALGW